MSLMPTSSEALEEFRRRRAAAGLPVPAQPGEATATPTAQPAATPTAAYSGDPLALVRQYQQQNPWSYGQSSLTGLYDFLRSQGVNADYVDHRGQPSADKMWINGSMYDVVGSSDAPDAHWALNDVTAQHYGAGGSPQSGYAAPAGGSTASGSSTMGLDPATFGSMLAPWTQQFDPRDPNEIANDPSYQFQLKEGTNAIERGALAKGTFFTGGTAKDLMKWGQGLASTFDDKYYNRDLGEYLLGRENFYNNQDRPYNKLLPVARMGQDAAAANAASGSSYANTIAQALYGIGNANAAGSAASGNTWGDFLGGMGSDWSDYLRQRQGGASYPGYPYSTPPYAGW